MKAYEKKKGQQKQQQQQPPKDPQLSRDQKLTPNAALGPPTLVLGLPSGQVG